jgi:hypothetical protein
MLPRAASFPSKLFATKNFIYINKPVYYRKKLKTHNLKIISVIIIFQNIHSTSHFVYSYQKYEMLKNKHNLMLKTEIK